MGNVNQGFIDFLGSINIYFVILKTFKKNNIKSNNLERDSCSELKN